MRLSFFIQLSTKRRVHRTRLFIGKQIELDVAQPARRSLRSRNPSKGRWRASSRKTNSSAFHESISVYFIVES
jgi:hypothetical protein